MSYGNGSTKATTYIVMVPEIYGYGSGERYVRSLRVDRVRSGKPALRRGEIAVKLNMTFKDSALLDSIPEVSIDVSNFAVAPPEPILEVVSG